MQDFYTVPIVPPSPNTSGIEVDGLVSYAPNLQPTTSAAELVIDAYYVWMNFFA